MQTRPFLEPSNPPTEESLQKTFGKVYEFYQTVAQKTSRFKKEWSFSKNSGWVMKAHDKKKALYCLIPLNESFIVSLTVRDQEKMQFLADADLKLFHEELRQ